jgi:large subunit ribosomal protein L7/L12
MSRLDELEKKKERLLAQIKREKAKVSNEEKKADTRRKILLGAYLLHLIEKDENLSNHTKQNLGAFLLNNKVRKATKVKNLELFETVFGDQWVLAKIRQLDSLDQTD